MQLSLLGPMELRTAAGELVDVGSPQRRAVLALLAMYADRVVPVDRVLDAVWEGHPPPGALASLHTHVSHLRRALEPGRDGPPTVLVRAAGGYGLMTGTVALDTRDVERRLAAAREHAARGDAPAAVRAYDEVEATWRGDTYADVRLAEWAQPEIARLDDLRSTAAEERAVLLVEGPTPLLALDDLVRLTDRYPLREAPWRLLATLHARTGRQAEALDALRRYRTALADELGLDVSPAVHELELAVLRGEVAPAPPPSSSSSSAGAPGPAPAAPPAPPAGVPSAGPLAAPLLVGRHEELDLLRAAAASVDEGGSALVLVDGEPGAGKSTLVEALAWRGALPVHVGRCPDHETAPPLWPWEQILRSLAGPGTGGTGGTGDTDGSAGTDALPPLVAALLDPAPAPAGSAHEDVQGTRLRLFDEVASVVSARAPVALVVEDLHAADEASTGLLEHLAISALPGVLLVATFRRHDASALAPLLTRAARLGASRVHLEGLAVAEVAELVRALTGRAPDDETAVALTTRTGGNPFLVGELARSGASLTEAARDVVTSRVDALGDPVRAALEAGAVIGDHLEPWLVAEVSGRSLHETVEALDVAEGAGLVTRRPDAAHARFAHALVVDALLERRSAGWAALAHERCAVALTRTRGDREEQHGAIARHWLAAAELGPAQAGTASEFCVRAARSAMARHAPGDATTYWAEAVATGQLAGASSAELLELRIGLAEAAHDAGRWAEGYAAAVDALEELDRAVPVGEEWARRVVHVGDVCMARTAWMPFPEGMDPVELRTRLDRALALLPAGDPVLAVGLGVRAVVAATLGRLDDVGELSDRAWHTASDGAGDRVRTRVAHLRLIALRPPPFVEERATAADALRSIPGLDPESRVVADLMTTAWHVEHGRRTEAERGLADVLAAAAPLRSPGLVRQVRSTRVGMLLFDGRHDEALELLDRLDQVSAMADDDAFRAAEAGQRVLASLQAGRLTDWLPVLEELAEGATSSFGFARGLALAEAGRPDEAAECLRRPMPLRDWTWMGAAVVRAMLAVRLCDRQVLEECRADLLPFSGTIVVTGSVTLVLGAADALLGEVSLALGDEVRAREELTRGLALLDPWPAPYWRHRARQALDKSS